MYLGVVDVKGRDNANGRGYSATIYTSGKGGYVFVSFRI